MNALLFILGFVSIAGVVVYALHRAGALDSVIGESALDGIEEEFGDLRDEAEERIADAKRRIREKIEAIKRDLDALREDA